ncbi:MAG: hypothetical protein L7F78_21675, partial [Syntrophales bacterium LBB04]|nr:hypothetical protein [Syntrophales bacterium LBB04]
TLVNRVNMTQALKEFVIQQMGLTDEGNAVRIGKWLTAEEAVTGKISALGGIVILQAKRINMMTMGTLALRSIKCKAGSEEMLMDNMHELARALAETADK